MTKITTKLFSSIFLLSALAIMACQKEQNPIKPNSINTSNTARLGDDYDLSKGDFRISLDTAVAYTTRFQQKKQAQGLNTGDYAVYYDIPANGLVQLYADAAKKGMVLAKVRCYQGIKMVDGKPQETLVYMGVDASGNELYQESVGSYSGPRLEVLDGGGACPGCPNLQVINTSNSLK